MLGTIRYPTQTRAAGYTNSDGRSATEEKGRRLVYRLNLSSADAELLLGMLRHVGRGK